jgi:hypothetical protein
VRGHASGHNGIVRRRRTGSVAEECARQLGDRLPGLAQGEAVGAPEALNEDLKQAGEPSRIGNLAAVHDDFATPWVAWNIVRTLASTAAFGCLAWALVLRGRRGRAEREAA